MADRAADTSRRSSNGAASELRAVIAGVRARWARRAFLRAWMLGAGTAGAMFLVGVLAVWLIAPKGIPLVFVVVTVSLVAGVALSFACLPLARPPNDRQIARFIEEQAGGLDEVIVTAVSRVDLLNQESSGPVVDRLVADAIRAARGVDVERIVTRDSMVRAAAGGGAATVALAVAFWLFAPSASRAIDVAGSHLLPSFYAIEVTPGSIKVREGQPVTVTARMSGIDGGVTPSITVGRGDQARTARMSSSFAKATEDKPAGRIEEFTITLNNITRSFQYVVTAGALQSSEFTVDVIRPVRVTRIDVRYDYAPGLGLESHTEEDGGDIFAPSGTRVQLRITTDKPVTSGQLTLADGSSMTLAGHNQAFSADLVVSKDGFYRVGLLDVDGLSNDGGTEYFIRVLNDRPSDVRILRPAGDKQVSPLEEVLIEARADDDYGVRSLELVVKLAAGREKVIALAGPGRGSVATGLHTLFLEDLNVRPGDVVTYHARATDVGRGRRSMESRSDIFFLEVKPYEEEFVASESQGGGMSGQETGFEDLIAQQKDILAATWKLDARARRGGAGVQSAADIRAIAEVQRTLRSKAEEVVQQMAGAMAADRRRLGPQGRGLTSPGDDPLPRAIDAMARAAAELDKLCVAAALPHEEQALAELLKAAAKIRRRQVAMQQARGGGGNGNRNQPDLSTLFDQELRKRQETNYEQQSTTTDNSGQQQDGQDPLAAIRELARRQEALSKQQRDLAANRDQMAAEDIKRRLERLTREQEELRRQAEELAKRTQGAEGARSAHAGQGAQGGSESQKLREISEEMRNAAADLRREDPRQASARGSKAGQALRDVEQRMQSARPEERRRAAGDLQLEARQIADAERRLGSEAARTAPGAAGDDARRRLAGEQERLADRTERLVDSVKRMASGAEGDERRAMAEASRELEQQSLSGRMRESAQGIRQGKSGEPQAVESTENLARALDKIADQLGSASPSRDGEASRLSDQLSRAWELRDRLDRLQRSMDELEKQGAQGARDAQGAKPGAEGRDGASGQQGSSAGGRDGVLERLQRSVDEQMREAQKLAAEMQRDNPGMQKGGTTPEQWQRSISAPGTQSFQQDFSTWESLKNNLLAALEQTESQLSDQLRAREGRERLNAGRHDGVADSYRALVDRYYQSLAVPRSQKQPARR